MKPPQHHETRRIHLAWALLIAATLLSWWLAEGPGAQGPGLASAIIVLALSALKGLVITLDFMELKHAPKLWRRALLAWLGAILLIILSTRVFS